MWPKADRVGRQELEIIIGMFPFVSPFLRFFRERSRFLSNHEDWNSKPDSREQ